MRPIKNKKLLLSLLVTINIACSNLKPQESSVTGKWIPDAEKYNSAHFSTRDSEFYGALTFFHIEPPDTFIFYTNNQFCLKYSKYHLKEMRSDSFIASIMLDSMTGTWKVDNQSILLKEPIKTRNTTHTEQRLHILNLSQNKLTAIFGAGFYSYKLHLKKIQ